jgi:hypothetical protein
MTTQVDSNTNITLPASQDIFVIRPPSPPETNETVTTPQVESNINIIIPTTEQDVYDARPPSPPETNETVTTPQVEESQQHYYIPGNFDYIKCKASREMIENAYNAVNQLELWHFMKKDCESYMMSNSPEIWIITAKMAELGYDGHSGFSFGWTMRQIQYIAKHGGKKFMEEWINVQNNKINPQ